MPGTGFNTRRPRRSTQRCWSYWPGSRADALRGRCLLTSLAPSEIRVVIVGAMLAMFLSALDQTIVATALPPIASDLGDFALISWVVTAYLLTATCVTPIVGKLSDLYGRRRMMTVCLVVFMTGSALC